MQQLKKQLFIYLAVLVVLALIQHPDLFIAPIDRIGDLPKAVVYGMGAFHPFIFAFIAYLFFALITYLFSLIKRVFTV
jgi:hypothetical protein